MRIEELFSPKSAYKLSKTSKNRWSTNLPDGSNLWIAIYEDGRFPSLQVYHSDFGRSNEQRTSDVDDFGITGEGDAPRILSTVIKFLGKWLSKNQPDYFYFTANEPSRAKLYQSMIRRLAGQAGYYQIDKNSAPEELRPLWSSKNLSSGETPFVLAKK